MSLFAFWCPIKSSLFSDALKNDPFLTLNAPAAKRQDAIIGHAQDDMAWVCRERIGRETDQSCTPRRGGCQSPEKVPAVQFADLRCGLLTGRDQIHYGEMPDGPELGCGLLTGRDQIH